MIYLRTGKPGASKTLNTLKEIIEDDDNRAREKFYYNINILLLDWEICNSFKGYFYGVFLPSNKKESINRRVAKIHEEDRHVELEDFPYLAGAYDDYDALELFVGWVKRLYSRTALEPLDELEDFNPNYSFSELEPLNYHFNQIDFKQFTKWYELPRRSIIIGDEVQQVWKKRDFKKEAPKSVTEMETHRHKGWDLHLITQHHMLIDVDVRRQVGKHINYYNMTGGKAVERLENSEVFDPSDYHAKKDALKSKIGKDSNYFGLYYSADNHTHKSKLPKILVALIFPILLLVAIVLFFKYLFFGSSDEEIVANQDLEESTESIVQSSILNPLQAIGDTSNETPVNLNFKPLNPYLPFSAPAFEDELNIQVLQDARCITVDDRCFCTTHQASTYNVDISVCNYLSSNSYFNPFVESGDDDEN